MKDKEHIAYSDVVVTCRCGNTFTTRSTIASPLQIEPCANCHPFYTGKQKQQTTTGRIEKFKHRYEKNRDKLPAVHPTTRLVRKRGPISQKSLQIGGGIMSEL